MRHTRPITRIQSPAPAQFQVLLQLLGILQTLVSVYGTIIETFFPDKAPEEEA